MIVQGKVTTPSGYKNITDLKLGDEILNQRKRRRKIVSINTYTTKSVVTFRKNPDLILTPDTVFNTVYGKQQVSKSGQELFFLYQNGNIVKDVCQICELEKEVTCYEIITDPEDCFYINNYIIVKQENIC